MIRSNYHSNQYDYIINTTKLYSLFGAINLKAGEAISNSMVPINETFDAIALNNLPQEMPMNKLNYLLNSALQTVAFLLHQYDDHVARFGSAFSVRSYLTESSLITRALRCILFSLLSLLRLLWTTESAIEESMVSRIIVDLKTPSPIYSMLFIIPRFTIQTIGNW